MKPAYKKFTKELEKALEKGLAKKETKALIASIEKAKEEGEDVGQFEMVVSTAFKDRAGEIVEQKGIDLSRYKKNPIVLFAHDYYSLPVGVTESIKLKDGKLIAKGRFAPRSANPLAQQIRQLYDEKIIRAASIGFIVKEMDDNRITKSELLEWSFVPVPANPQALALAKKYKIDAGELKKKGVFTEVKEKTKKHIIKVKEIFINKKGELVMRYTNGHSKTRRVTGTLLKQFGLMKEMTDLKETIGPITAKMQNDIDQIMIKGSEKIQTAIEKKVTDKKELSKNDKKSGAAKSGLGSGKNKKDKKKVDQPGSQKTAEELKAWEDLQRILRVAATAVTEGLTRVNKRV